MRKFCEDKVSSSLQPSQNRSDKLLKKAVSSVAANFLSSHVVFSSSQVHLLLQWTVIRYDQDEQQSSVPASDPRSITAKLSDRRRSVCAHRCWCTNLTAILKVKLTFFVLDFVVCRILSLPENLPVSEAGLHLGRIVSFELLCVFQTALLWVDLHPSLSPSNRCDSTT